MPKLETKTVQKELESRQLWPVYWIHGPERMKARELVKRIQQAVFSGQDNPETQSFSTEVLDGGETDAATVVDAARSLSLLGGGLRFVIVREAHLIKDQEPLGELLGPKGPAAELSSVCVFLSKDLDGRKKFSKQLVDKAAVVACDEVGEDERESWIQYLSKRRGVTLTPSQVAQLRSIDPWGLDIMDQELEKFSLSGQSEDVFQASLGLSGGSDAFLEAFFAKNLKEALVRAESFADQPDESLPLLGLLAWNVRHLALLLADQAHGTQTVKLNPYLAEKLRGFSRGWTLAEMLNLQHRLFELDFGMKQTPLLPLGLWAGLVAEFCVH